MILWYSSTLFQQIPCSRLTDEGPKTTFFNGSILDWDDTRHELFESDWQSQINSRINWHTVFSITSGFDQQEDTVSITQNETEKRNYFEIRKYKSTSISCCFSNYTLAISLGLDFERLSKRIQDSSLICYQLFDQLLDKLLDELLDELFYQLLDQLLDQLLEFHTADKFNN